MRGEVGVFLFVEQSVFAVVIVLGLGETIALFYLLNGNLESCKVMFRCFHHVVWKQFMVLVKSSYKVLWTKL